MLWTLLVLINSESLPVGSLFWARLRTEPMWIRYSLALTIGLVMAVGNLWVWSKPGSMAAARVKTLSEAAQNRRLRALYLSAIVWMPVGVTVGYWVTRLIAGLFLSKT